MCVYGVGGDSPETVFKLRQNKWSVSDQGGGVGLVMAFGIYFPNGGVNFFFLGAVGNTK